jgi:hypothetical protein
MRKLVYAIGVVALVIVGHPIIRFAIAACGSPTGVSLATYGGNWVNAFNAAVANGSYLVTVPAGTWPSPQILPPSGMTIQGAGLTTTFVTRSAPGTFNNGGLFKVTTTNVRITDLTARGWPIASGTSDDILINGLEATGLTVQRVRLENAQGIGVQLEGALMTGCLFEDVTIYNTLLRSNGAHGVGLWPYRGTSNCTFRRITVDLSASANVALDAGTTGSPNALSVDNNVFENLTLSRPAGTVGAIMLTGGNNNSFTNTTISNVPSSSPATAWGIDQSGLGTAGNTFTNTTVSALANGDFAWMDPAVCGNTINGGTGTATARDPGNCNTFTNWPGLTVVH